MLQNKNGGAFCWTRIVSSKWEDAWMERLRGTGDIVVTTLTGSRSARLDVYCTQKSGEALRKQFGGRISRVDSLRWKAALDRVPNPISIRGKLIIHQRTSSDSFSRSDTSSSTTPKSLKQSKLMEPRKRNGKSPRSLFIPAEMAFGSGSHVTTASCLRMLCDLESVLSPSWRMLDLGTGSGILALGACALGAGKVLGIDFDPVAIRIARHNWLRNREGLKQAPRFENFDVSKKFPPGRYEVVCANLFADLLIKIAPRILRALSPRGWWIFSGVLVEQISEVRAAMRKAGFGEPTIRRGGKWVAGIAQKPD
ncbi:MAG: hypothetical protein C5B47_07780 [Verrucomicrobia bacterium]|nr:MAG: hypothetical protein C5B47_07780 [Verrucomicrobiota bacterium]